MEEDALHLSGLLPELYALSQSAVNRNHYIRTIVGLLVAHGAVRCRYYDVAPDRTVDGHLAELVDLIPVPHPRCAFHIGCRQPIAAWFGSTDGPTADIKPNSSCGGADCADHEAPSGTRIEIPVVSGVEVVGAIAIEWPDRPEKISDQDRALLGVVGHLVGDCITLDYSKTVAEARAAIDSLDHSLPPLELVVEGARAITVSLNVAITAVFEYQWASGMILKVAEVSNPALHLAADELPESYEVGQYLTGAAWVEPKYRYVPDFGLLGDRSAPVVNLESRERHDRLLGRVQSIMYVLVGQAEKRFLIRLMNRIDRPSIPIFNEEDLLQQLGAKLSSYIDAATARMRAADLGSVARQAASDPGSPDSVLQEVRSALVKERVSSFVVCCHPVGGSRFSLVRAYGDIVRGWRPDPRAAWHADPLHREIVRQIETNLSVAVRPAIQCIDLRSELVSDDGIGGMLARAGTAGLLVFPIATGHTRGALIIPLPRRLRRDRHDLVSAMRSELVDTATTIQAYADLIGAAIDARSSYLTTEGARHVLGFIGHELGTPLATLGEIGLEAIIVGQRRLNVNEDQQDRQTYWQLERLYQQLNDTRRTLSQILALAPLVAQESQGRLQLHFQRVSIYDVLEESKAQIESENNARHERRSDVRIELSSSCRKLPEVCCDRALIGQVLVNLLRNACKYSLPRRRGERPVVRVTGQRQQKMTIIQVENWGIGIPPDRLEEIFEPFVRGDVEDRIKAIRGMGLGLFLGRRIMSAHRGELFCLRSDPTLDDPRRTERLEGFQTIFELRLPVDLKEGTVTVDLNESSRPR